MAEKATPAEKSALETLESFDALAYVVAPADLPVPMQMRATALFASYAEAMGEHEDDEEFDFSQFGPMVNIGADVLDWIYAHAATDREALDKEFHGNLSRALEFAFAYVGAVGELFSSDAS